MKEKLLISACLLGVNCKYSGGNNSHPLAERLKERFELVPICPEQLGGLPTPRAPSERMGDRVVTRDGGDVTEQFRLGAARALEIARKNGVTRALLKERSPSCGYGAIYDGTFTSTVVPESGVTAELLEGSGVQIIGESAIETLLQSRSCLTAGPFLRIPIPLRKQGAISPRTGSPV